jgi:hypothetical protein
LTGPAHTTPVSGTPVSKPTSSTPVSTTPATTTPTVGTLTPGVIPSPWGDPPCGIDAKGRQLYLSPKSGCYYINNGKQEFVDRSECKC